MISVAKVSSAFSRIQSVCYELNQSSFCKLELDLVSPTVYLKGLEKCDIELSGPAILRGMAVLYLNKPAKLNNVKVLFRGTQSRTYVDLILIKAYESIKLKKMKKEHTLVDDFYNWNYLGRTMKEGIYHFPFLFIIDHSLPESYLARHFSVGYSVDVEIELGGRMETNPRVIRSSHSVQLIRCLGDINYSDSAIATGNWRDLLVYQFSFNSRTAFQNSTFLANIKVYPLVKKGFKIYYASAFLIQTLRYENTDGSIISRNSTDTEKFLLLKKYISPPSLMEEDGCFNIDLLFDIPSFATATDKESKKAKKPIYPTMCTQKDRSITSHSIKLVMSVSECVMHESRILQEENNHLDPCSVVLLSNSSLKSNNLLKTSSCDSNSRVPGYSTFHEKRNDHTKYKRIELSFSIPITLLCHDSKIASSSPPLYSKNFDQVIENNSCLTINKSNLFPPNYEDLKSL